jgi:hypothetical protein
MKYSDVIASFYFYFYYYYSYLMIINVLNISLFSYLFSLNLKAFFKLIKHDDGRYSTH